MSKSVTKDCQHSLVVQANRGIMRFSFVGVGPFRAFVSDLDTIGSLPPRMDWLSGPREGRGVGRRLSRPGTFDIDGCSPRLWGQDGRPRTRDMAPAGVVCTRSRGMSPPGHPGCDDTSGLRRRASRVSGPRRLQGLVSGPRRRAAFQETAWKGTLKTVVQRPSPWLTLRLPPRASTRRRAPSRPRPEEKAS